MHVQEHAWERGPLNIGQGILSEDLMDRECNCSLPSKVNGKCVYKGKCKNKCLIYKVKSSMCDTIYIGNTQQKLKKIINSHFSDILRLLKNRKNQIHLLTISNNTLMLLRHVQIYVSI